MLGPSLGIVETIFLCNVWMCNGQMQDHVHNESIILVFQFNSFLCHINVDVISYYPSSQLSISHSFLVCHTRHVASIIPNCHIPTRFHEKYDVIMKPLHMSIFREVYFALFAYNLYDHDAHTHAHIETL